jgi:hypothetical protein
MSENLPKELGIPETTLGIYELEMVQRELEE